MGKYDDIINMPYVKSKKRRPMSLYNRAAQFSPFAALVGYDSSLNEVSRTTHNKKQLSDEDLDVLNKKLTYFMDEANRLEEVKVTYFIHDKTKEGGKYENLIGKISKIDTYKKFIVLKNVKINFDDILSIESDNFFNTYNFEDN